MLVWITRRTLRLFYLWSGFDKLFNNRALFYPTVSLTTKFFDMPGHQSLWRANSSGSYPIPAPEAIVLPRVTPVKKGEMIICYHCDGKPIGETTFPYSQVAYADWLRSMADQLARAAAPSQKTEMFSRP